MMVQEWPAGTAFVTQLSDEALRQDAAEHVVEALLPMRLDFIRWRRLRISCTPTLSIPGMKMNSQQARQEFMQASR